MRWFKHMTGTRRDEKVARLIAERGFAAYGRYWAVLETVAEGMDKGSSKCAVTYPSSAWSHILQAGSNAHRILLQFQKKGLVKVSTRRVSEHVLSTSSASPEHVLSTSSASPEHLLRRLYITVEIPNLLKYRDEYSGRPKRVSGQTPDKLQSKKQRQNTDTDALLADARKADSLTLAFAGAHVSITQKQDGLLAEAFPWADRGAEYRRMDSWLEANPGKRPKAFARFAHNWMSRIDPPGGKPNGKQPRSIRQLEEDRALQQLDKFIHGESKSLSRPGKA